MDVSVHYGRVDLPPPTVGLSTKEKSPDFHSKFLQSAQYLKAI